MQSYANNTCGQFKNIFWSFFKLNSNSEFDCCLKWTMVIWNTCQNKLSLLLSLHLHCLRYAVVILWAITFSSGATRLQIRRLLFDVDEWINLPWNYSAIVFDHIWVELLRTISVITDKGHSKFIVFFFFFFFFKSSAFLWESFVTVSIVLPAKRLYFTLWTFFKDKFNRL